MSELREFLDRGVVGANDVNLVEGVWRTSRRRRRNRRLMAGSSVAAVAVVAIAVSQWGGASSSPEDLAPAGDRHTATQSVGEDQLLANQHFLDGLRASGLQVDYRPLKSPTLAISPSAARVVVGEVGDVRVSGDNFVVTIDVQQTIPDNDQQADRIDVLLDSGPLHEVTTLDAAAVGGPVLVVLRNQVQPADESAPLRPYVDGFWINVPGGIGNPYADYADMREAWPPVTSVEELAAVLTEAEVAARPEDPPPPEMECSASYQNPPFVNETGLTPAAFATADNIFGDAANCDREALLARAVADGTTIAIGEGDLEEQLVIPDPSGAYIGLAGALTREATTADDGELHTFDSNGWRVVINSDGRWVEFSRE